MNETNEKMGYYLDKKGYKKELDELIFTLSTEIGGKIFIASASGRGTIISLK